MTPTPPPPPSPRTAFPVPALLLLPALLGAVPALGVDLPAEIAGAPGSGVEPGFRVRSAQGPILGGEDLPLTLLRGIQQLNGTLVDSAGRPVDDSALAGPNADGSHPVAGVINFEATADPETGNFLEDADFPGTSHDNNFTTEVVTFLELEAGEHTFGVQTFIQRTDAPGGGDDDVAVLFAGENGRDFFNLEVGRKERSAGAPAFEEVPDDSVFTFTAPAAGLYPFRLIYVQKTSRATLEWYSVDPATGDLVLINDPDDDRAVRAFQSSTALNHHRPYVAEVSPLPGGSGVSPGEPVNLLLEDDETFVNPATVQLFHNGADVTADAAIAKGGSRTTVFFQPNPLRGDEENALRLTFRDSAGATVEREWGFQIRPEGVAATRVTGQWDFDAGLEATVGQDLEFFGGPGGTAATSTTFGTTTEFGIPDIGGEVARVMCVPGTRSRDIGYVMHHGISPNGGGARVNQYTLIMDVYVVAEGPGFAGFLQVNSTTNADDSDFFWRRNDGNFGQGAGGYNGLGAFTGDAWHRVILAVDLAATPPLVTKFVDGELQDNWVQVSLDQDRRALRELSILFTDGDDGEQHAWYVNSVQIRDGKLSDIEMELLGGPAATGIPVSPFDDPNIAVTRGNVFGDLPGPPAPEVREIAVKNTGESLALEISAVTVTGPDAGHYTVEAFPAELALGASGAIRVAFDPAGRTGAFEAALEVASNDAGDPVATIDLGARIPNPNGLVAHYAMDEAAGEAMLDSSGHRYHGTYRGVGGGTFTLGADGLAGGTAVGFDAAGGAGAGFGEVLPEAGIPPLQTVSLSLWMRSDPAAAGSVAALLSKGVGSGDPFALVTVPSAAPHPAIWFVSQVQELESEAVMSLDTVHHVVVTHSDPNGASPGADRLRLYVDGQPRGEASVSAGYEDTIPTVLQIGALNGAFGFTGTLDDVQIYDREISAAEVAMLFANPGQVLPAPVVGAGDRDGDGIPDEVETALGLDPDDPADGAADRDGDGASNRAEFLAGTAIDDASSTFRAALAGGAGGGDFTLTWPSAPGLRYRVEFKGALTDPAWQPLPGGAAVAAEAGAGGSTSFTDTGAGGAAARFYRITLIE